MTTELLTTAPPPPAPFADLRARLERLVAALQQDDSVQLLTFNLFEPASDESIARVRRYLTDELDRPLGLDGGVEAFYRQTNGLQLRWMDRDNGFMDLPYHPERDVFRPEPLPWSSFLDDDVARTTPCGYGVASVMILPIEHVFFHAMGRYDRYDIHNVLGVEYAENVSPYLFNFNYYDCDHCHALDLIDPARPPQVIEAFDRYDLYQLFIDTTFGDYLDRVFQTQGLYDFL